jgi:predicted RNase H-like HicB family nuclease
MRQIFLYSGEDDLWVAECPSLQGCISEGKTKGEAIANIRGAIQGYIEALKGDGSPIPEDKFDAILVDV